MKPPPHDSPSIWQAKILEVTSYPPPRAGWGVRVSYLRRWLEARGHHCEVLNIGANRRVRGLDYTDVQGANDFLVKLLRLARRSHVVHAHINGDGNKGWALALVAELVARLWRKGCALTFHAGPRQRFFPRERSRLCVPFFWLIFRLAAVIICNSSSVKECIQGYGVRSRKIHVIPAFSHQYLAYECVRLEPELEDFLATHQPVLLSYFFMRSEFFLETLFQAVRELAQFHRRLGLVVVGGDTRSPALYAMLGGAGIKDHTYCAGDLAHDEFMTLLPRAHIYVRTPPKDGVCSSVLEALSLSVPVVASENSLRPSGVITFKPAEAKSLVDAIESTWKRYEEVRANLVPPRVEDTLALEGNVLVALAGDHASVTARLREG